MGKGIGRRLDKAGATVNYREASKIAAKTGVSIDDVYAQAQRRGQTAKAGRNAAEAGYVLGAGVNPNQGYIDQYAANAQKALEDLRAQQPAQPGAEGAVAGAEQPTFDWDAWNLQMMEQQAAIWASMDAMNAQFLQQQQQWQQSQQSYGLFGNKNPASTIFRQNNVGGTGSTDQAAVKRKKKKNPSKTASGTTLSIGTGSGGGVSTGGQGASSTLGIG
jgi:hypothetical protein